MPVRAGLVLAAVAALAACGSVAVPIDSGRTNIPAAPGWCWPGAVRLRAAAPIQVRIAAVVSLCRSSSSARTLAILVVELWLRGRTR